MVPFPSFLYFILFVASLLKKVIEFLWENQWSGTVYSDLFPEKMKEEKGIVSRVENLIQLLIFICSSDVQKIGFTYMYVYFKKNETLRQGFATGVLV